MIIASPPRICQPKQVSVSQVLQQQRDSEKILFSQLEKVRKVKLEALMPPLLLRSV
jgi:hypothetical protein